MPSPLGFSARLALAWRVLTDGAQAARAAAALDGPAAPPALPEPEPAAPPPRPVDLPAAHADGALQLLALLQREGRLVDFLQQDVTTFPDADVGVAARVVHEGCGRVLKRHVAVEPARPEAEGGAVTVAAAEVARVKLVGEVRGAAPFHGRLVHRGWVATRVELPQAAPGHDARLLMPAEVEL